jgi:hypothetical protein
MFLQKCFLWVCAGEHRKGGVVQCSAEDAHRGSVPEICVHVHTGHVGLWKKLQEVD